jgi:hypothetical protein
MARQGYWLFSWAWGSVRAGRKRRLFRTRQALNRPRKAVEGLNRKMRCCSGYGIHLA